MYRYIERRDFLSLFCPMSSSPRRLIVVVGVSGRQGGSVIESLLEHPDLWSVRGLTTDLKSAFVQELLERQLDVVHCDTNDPEEYRRLFRDAYGVFAVTNYCEAEGIGEYQQALQMFEAARQAQVKHFILSLFPDIDHEQAPIEDYIRQLPSADSFPHLTLVRVGYYYQNLITFFVSERTTCTFRYPFLENKSIPFYDVRDTGKVIAKCFEQPERWSNGPVIPLVAEFLSMEEICPIIQAEMNKEMKFVALSPEQAASKVNWYILKTLRWYSDQRQVEQCEEVSVNLRKFVDWIRETNRLFE